VGFEAVLLLMGLLKKLGGGSVSMLDASLLL
jgi:hypothetical protein